MTEWAIRCAECGVLDERFGAHFDAVDRAALHRIRYGHGVEIVAGDEVSGDE